MTLDPGWAMVIVLCLLSDAGSTVWSLKQASRPKVKVVNILIGLD
jgi:hypothetical protein